MWEKGKELYLYFVDLEKGVGYNEVGGNGVWELWEIYGTEGCLLKAVKSFYERV